MRLKRFICRHPSGFLLWSPVFYFSNDFLLYQAPSYAQIYSNFSHQIITKCVLHIFSNEWLHFARSALHLNWKLNLLFNERRRIWLRDNYHFNPNGRWISNVWPKNSMKSIHPSHVTQHQFPFHIYWTGSLSHLARNNAP